MNIGFDKEKCSACGACAVACMDEHDIDLAAGERPFRRVWTEETETAVVYHSDGCLHCRAAACMEVCPTEAILRDRDTGFVYIEQDYCLGCGKCRRICPQGAIAMSRERRAQKCDGCRGRVKQGLLPVCVSICPYGALRLEK